MFKTSLLASAGLALLLASATAAVLPDSVTPFSPAVRVVGAADPRASVTFHVALRLRDAAGLAASNAAGHVQSPAEFAARHLPAAADRDAVAAWLRGQGLGVEVMPGGMSLQVRGSAAQVARALGVSLHHIVSEGRDYIATASAPTVPDALAAKIVGINGLQPHLHAIHQFALPPLAAGGKTPLYPSDLLTAYSANNLGTLGAGTTTAIIIDTFPLAADVTSFWAKTGVAQSLSNITLIQTVAGTLPKPGGEESLDTEYTSSIAPASKVRVYASTDLSFVHLDVSFQDVIADLQNGVKITQVSISLGGCETGVAASEKTTDDQYFATMTALGASVFVSSGDYGAKECGYLGLTGPKTPSFFATSPNVAAIGGTTLTLNADSTEKTETAWSVSIGSGSGGGISKFFATPSYQSGLHYTHRATPDVAADGNPNTGVLVIVNGKSQQVGGTSVSAPVWAGLMGLVNASRLSAGKTTLGLVGPRVYPLAGTASFRDIVSGNNGYPAGPGYDLVTGIGAPVMSHLLPALKAQR